MNSHHAGAAEFAWNVCLARRNQLTEENDLLALKIAHRMRGQCTEPLQDLFQLARLGLMRASEKFDPEMGVAFSSYAVPYIRGEIQHFLRDRWYGPKVPRRSFEAAGAVKRVQRQLAEQGREMEADEVAKRVGMPAEKWRWISDEVQRRPIAPIEDALSVAAPDNSEEIETEHQRQQVRECLARLPKLQRQCITAQFFYGLRDDQIARRYHLQVSEVQRLIKQAIERLHQQLQEAL